MQLLKPVLLDTMKIIVKIYLKNVYPPPMRQSCGMVPMNLSQPLFPYKKVKYNIKIEHGNTWCAPPSRNETHQI